MSKGKLEKFADMARYENVFQYPYSVAEQVPFEMKGGWRKEYFHNDNPIVLEYGGTGQAIPRHELHWSGHQRSTYVDRSHTGHQRGA